MGLSDNIEEYRQAANYLMVRNRLRPLGIGAIIFGSIAVLGGAVPPHTAANALLILLGVMLLGMGIWVVRAPSLAGMVTASAVIAVVGIWNISDSVLREDVSYFWLVFGAFQLYWAYTNLVQYRQLSEMTGEKPTDEAVQSVDRLAKDVWKRRPQDSADLIVYVARTRRWKCWLMDDAAISVCAGGQGIAMAEKENVVITREREFPAGKMLRVSVRLGDREEGANLSAEHFQRYEAWKSSSVVGSETAGEQPC